MLNKRLLPILFSLLLSLSFVSGCSRNEVIENPISVETDNVVTTETPQEKEIVKIENDTTIKEDSSVEVHFIDVGQADAALLISDNEVMLIDGGNAPDSNLIYSYLTKHNIIHIDYMIGTHAHEDHMGGLSGALSKATVGTVFAPKTENDAKFYQSFKRLVSEKGLSITNPQSGQTFKLGSCKVQLYCPTYESASDLNNTSIMTKVVCGETSFLFTGDAEAEEERDIINQGYDLSATVLKAGHHGSDTSSSYVFLREVMPEYVVISVGKNNQYGHPDEGALSRFRDVGAKTYRTDLQGDIILQSNGKEITVNTQKNATIEVNPTVPPVVEEENIVENTPSSSYIGNKNSKKFHYPSCHSLPIEKNRRYFNSRSEAISSGYDPCKNCNP